MKETTALFEPTETEARALRQFVHQGQGLTAWKKIQSLPPLSNWRGYEGRRTAARLAQALGNDRLNSVLNLINWRENPDHPRAFFQAAFGRFRWIAPAMMINLIEERLKADDLWDDIRADLNTLLALCFSDVGEYKKAESLVTQALETSAHPGWLHVNRSMILRRQDRYEEALEAVEEGRKVAPYYRPVVNTIADTLMILKRDDEAEAILRDACSSKDHPDFPLKLMGMLSDRDHIEEVSHWLNDFEKKAPLMSKSSRQWLAGRHADQASLQGNDKAFLQWADQTKKNSFHQNRATYYRKNAKPEMQRKRLNVAFVRQHNMTCAPATLAALSNYFGKNHDHLKIADAICYDGTPWHKERNWCLENGFEVREFAVTMASAKALIDANIPFTLTTREVTSAHLQACIGYDEKLGLLILRDPTYRHYVEVTIDSLIKNHPISGVRGMAFVPFERVEELKSMPLDKERSYDLWHELSVALDDHDVDTATKVIESYKMELAEDPLRYRAEAKLANYRGNPEDELNSIEKIHQQHPKSQSIWLHKLGLLKELARQKEVRDFLSEIVKNKSVDPCFFLEIGESLCSDIRTINIASFYLKKSLRHQSSYGYAYSAYALCLSLQNRQEEALQFRRWASLLSPTREDLAHQYYDASYFLGKKQEALQHLEERATKVGIKDVGPHLTLLNSTANQYSPQASLLAEDLLQKFPNNGDLLLRVVQLFSYWGKVEKARHHLAEAKGKVSQQRWIYTNAQLSEWLGERDDAVHHWRNLLECIPNSVNAHDAIARYTEEEEGLRAAINYTVQIAADSPNDVPLQKHLAEWLQRDKPEDAVPILQNLITIDEKDLWPKRELALVLTRIEQYELAISQAREAYSFDPRDISSSAILGHALAEAGHKEEASSIIQKTLSLDIDQTASFHDLLNLCENFSERKEALEFVRKKMIEQVSNGEIVNEFRIQATGILDSNEVLKDLQDFHQARPDLWQTWQALREHYTGMNQSTKAQEIAREMTINFPLLPRAWVELGLAERLIGNGQAEIKSFKQALSLSPSWDWVMRELSSALENEELYDEAVSVLEKAISFNPLTPGGYGYKADLLWKINRTDEALDTIMRGLEISPYYSYGWRLACNCSKLVNRESEVTTLMEKLTEDRASYFRWWAQSSEIYQYYGDYKKALIAINKGLDLAPENPDLLDTKAWLLSQLGKYEEAIEVTHFLKKGKRLMTLRGREASILMDCGHPEEAMSKMSTLSREEPDYFYAHQQLAKWSDYSEDWQKLRKAAKRMISIRPQESECWGYLGSAEEELGNQEEAIKAYEHAFSLDPDYLFPGRRILIHQIEKGELDKAHQTLRRIDHHHRSSWVRADAISLCLASGDENELITHWQHLLIESKELNEDPFPYVDDIFRRNKVEHLIYDFLKTRITEGEMDSPIEARAWGNQIIKRPKKEQKKLAESILSSEIGDKEKSAAIATVINHWSSENWNNLIFPFIEKDRLFLLAHAESWLACVNACSSLGRDEKGLEYGQNWRNYLDELEPISFVGLTGCMDGAAGIDHAFKVRTQILEHYPNWQGTQLLRLCTACYESTRQVSPDINQAKNWLAEFSEQDTSVSYYKFIFWLTKAALFAHEGNEILAKSNFVLAQEYSIDFTEDKAITSLLERTANSIATSLNLYNGKGKKLIKRWGKRKMLFGSDKSIWIIVILIFVAFRIIGCAMKDQDHQNNDFDFSSDKHFENISPETLESFKKAMEERSRNLEKSNESQDSLIIPQLKIPQNE